MTDSEITTTILRQLRDDMRELRGELRTFRVESRTFQDEMRGEFSIVHTLLRDAAGRLVTLVRYIKNKQDPAILDLRKRVGRIEKKVG